MLSRLASPGTVLLASAVWVLNSYTLRSFTLQALEQKLAIQNNVLPGGIWGSLPVPHPSLS